jgi:hypothetical protein
MKMIPATGLQGEALREAAAGELGDIVSLVSRAVGERIYPGRPDAYVSIEAIYADRVIVRRDGRSCRGRQESP